MGHDVAWVGIGGPEVNWLDALGARVSFLGWVSTDVTGHSRALLSAGRTERNARFRYRGKPAKRCAARVGAFKENRLHKWNVLNHI